MREEAGIECSLDRRLMDVRYVYTRGGQRIFKVVVFYLLRYRSGRIGDIEPSMRLEVTAAAWVPLSDWRRLSYRGERDAAHAAADLVDGSIRRGA